MLIISGKDALQRIIGTTLAVERAVHAFARSKKEYEVRFLYYDRVNSLKVKKAKKTPHSIRQFILSIEERWGDIDFLLLLGGDSVVPFFRLRNPCEDSDDVVVSDNPYASRDKDHAIPERACARIPDNRSAQFIVKQLQKYTKHARSSFGMTADVWKKASRGVYQTVGTADELKVSPPVTTKTFRAAWLQKKRFLYFNLHGSKQSANWYGQAGGNYPIALAPQNIRNASGVVATESCYGAHIIDTSDDGSLALTFLEEKAIVGFCGSTTIAYGPVAPPAGEADLLVKCFLEYVHKGLTLGESLKNAKVDFARTMLRRQGFLDDDDQKTLLQFVLYGDPTVRLQNRETKRQRDKETRRRTKR
jgi:hypothetical protein